MKEYGIAVIGAGMIGAAHASGYRTHAPRLEASGNKFNLLVACDARRESAEALARNYGFAEVATDWRAVIADPRVQVISVTLPNFEHAEVTAAALAAGKHVLCEKPLALSSAQARELVQLSRRVPVVAGTVFNYRRWPLVAEMRQLIASGQLGRLLHARIQYQSEYAADPQLPHSWRYLKDRAGGGALHDVGAHAVDMLRHLCGEIEEISGANTLTSIAQRYEPASAATGHGHVALSERRQPVDTDDITSCVLRLDNGCLASVLASRVAVGMGNTLEFEISGSEGTLRYDNARPNEYRLALRADGQRGFRVLNSHPAAPNVALTPVPHDGVAIGFGENFGFLIAEFMQAIGEGQPFSGSLEEGLRVAEILDAILLSAEQRRPVRIAELQGDNIINLGGAQQ